MDTYTMTTRARRAEAHAQALDDHRDAESAARSARAAYEQLADWADRTYGENCPAWVNAEYDRHYRRARRAERRLAAALRIIHLPHPDGDRA